MVKPIQVAGRLVGPGHPCFVIAEAGVNHNGDVPLARQLIDVAVRAGADAIKFQTFQAERVATAEAPKAVYQAMRTGRDESQMEMLSRLELSPQAHRDLMSQCCQRGILFLSSLFDEDSADLLDELGVPAFKIPSGEITNLPFLVHVARKGKPLIISTGMATLDEVKAAVRTVKEAGNSDLTLLHCVSSYPANPADVNLRAIHTLADTFKVPVGYSDHTLGTAVAVAAVALGACVIEKHLTLDRSLPGPDHQASLEPAEFANLIQEIRMAQAALGHGRKEPVPSEAEIAAVVRKSLVAAQTIPAGSVLTDELIAVKRPGIGLAPAMKAQVIGRRVNRDIPAGSVLSLDMLA